jgi:hypothetical protein
MITRRRGKRVKRSSAIPRLMVPHATVLRIASDATHRSGSAAGRRVDLAIVGKHGRIQEEQYDGAWRFKSANVGGRRWTRPASRTAKRDGRFAAGGWASQNPRTSPIHLIPPRSDIIV